MYTCSWKEQEENIYRVSNSVLAEYMHIVDAPSGYVPLGGKIKKSLLLIVY